ncbi:MAG: NAD(P)/FAD-dependent oxidoreductase [Dongiaceae bacterium]
MSGDTAAIDCLVIGAGVIGLAIARVLALAGRDVIVVERHDAIGTETSARNSEVIHAGIYYETGSLKARLCVDGKARLYEYCRAHGIAYRNCGKLIVAADAAQMPALEAIAARAKANGVEDLAILDGPAMRRLEPALHGAAAIHSPSTGIVDSHGFMLALQGDAEADGATIAFNTPFERATVTPEGFTVDCGGAEPMRLQARNLVNAAGLGAQAVAGAIEGLAPAAVPLRRIAKGNYFLLQGKAPFSRLIYPVPEAAGLGVHLTLDLDGRARFGPDVEWVETLDYEVNPARGESFYGAIRRYWPDLADGALLPGYSGIRTKLHGPGEPAADFRIDGPEAHGVAGLVNLFGIESPGLTSALAIAEVVRDKLAAPT